MNDWFQKLNDKYGHITNDKTQCTISLNHEQQLVLLYAYDYGIKALTPEMVAVLDMVMNEIKNELHP